MKKIFFLALTLAGLHSESKAQNVSILNSRSCEVDIKLVGTTPGGSCGDYIVHLYIPGGGGTGFYTPLTIGAASIPPAPPAPPSIIWNYAEIQNLDCCDGGGLGVGGDAKCVNPVTGLLMYPGPVACSTSSAPMCPPGTTFCASFTYPGPAPSDIQIVCY